MAGTIGRGGTCRPPSSSVDGGLALDREHRAVAVAAVAHLVARLVEQALGGGPVPRQAPEHLTRERRHAARHHTGRLEAERSRVAAVATEQLVTAVAGEHHPEVVGRHLRHQHGGDRAVVGEGLVVDVDQLVEEPLEVGLVQLGDHQVDVEVSCRLLHVAALVALPARHADAEGADAGVGVGGGGRHQRGVDAAGEEDAEGAVGDELAPHREVDRRPRGLDPVAVAEVGGWLLEALDPEQSHLVERVDLGGAAGHAADVAPGAVGLGHVLVAQVGVDGGEVGTIGQRAELAQRLGLGRERHGAVGGADEQRLDPELVACQHEAVVGLVDDGHREDAVEQAEHRGAELEVAGEHDLGVAGGRELVAAPVERAAELVGVVDLAVEDHADVVAPEGLATLRRVTDGEPAHAPRAAPVELVAEVVVGPTVDHDLDPALHAREDRPVPRTSRVDHTDDAAHAGLLAGRRVRSGPRTGAAGLRQPHDRRPRVKRRAIL